MIVWCDLGLQGERMDVLNLLLVCGLVEGPHLCCFAGIWAGMRTVRYFDGKTYKWVGLSRQPNIIGKVSLALISFQEKCSI